MDINKKRLTVGLVGLAMFGGVIASAATLGGLTSNELGANDTVVAACDTDGVAIAYTNAYDATTAEYTVTTATISGIAAGCVGQTLDVTLSGAAGVSLGSGTVTVAGASEAVAITGTVSAEAVTGAAVVISGV